MFKVQNVYHVFRCQYIVLYVTVMQFKHNNVVRAAQKIPQMSIEGPWLPSGISSSTIVITIASQNSNHYRLGV